MKFTSKITENLKAEMNKQDAIENAVDYAIENNFLDGFFKIHRAEIIGMCLTEFDEEEARRIWHQDGYTEGHSKGLAEGAQQKAIDSAINLLKKEVPVETIVDCIGLPLEKVLELQNSIKEQVPEN